MFGKTDKTKQTIMNQQEISEGIAYFFLIRLDLKNKRSPITFHKIRCN